MNESKTRRSPHKGTASHRKNKYLFQILPTLLCCSEWIQGQEGNREKASRKPQWKNYDFTMFLSRITASHGIAVDWYLRVYWLLPFSIVDSFAEHRRFFCRAPMILLLSTDDSFAEHRRFFCRAPTALLPSTDDSFTEHRRLFCRAPTTLLPSTDDSFAEHRRLFCRAPWILGLKIGSVENQWG